MKEKTSLKLELPVQESGISTPLNLRISYQPPKSEMDLIPFLDLVLIGFLFFMLSSRLVYAPGIAVDLPRAEQKAIQPILVTDVMTVDKRGENILFFYRGAIYDIESLRQYAETLPAVELNNSRVILVKMDGSFPLQMQADLVAITQRMGYSKVQIAMEPKVDS